jgi:RNA polymerase sigma-70 factor, ECF subfamily
VIEDREIIVRIQRGQINLMETLIERYKDSVYKFCLFLTKSQQEADDLFQETWIKVLKYIHQFDADKTFNPWLTSITLNIYRDRYRKSKRWISVIKQYFSQDEYTQEFKNIKSPLPDPQEAVIDTEQSEQLRVCINNLDDTYRLPIILFYFKELSHQEISHLLQIPIGTVKSRLSNGRKKLKEGMEVLEYE